MVEAVVVRPGDRPSGHVDDGRPLVKALRDAGAAAMSAAPEASAEPAATGSPTLDAALGRFSAALAGQLAADAAAAEELATYLDSSADGRAEDDSR